MIGDAGVGKSSIQTRFVNQTFSKPYELTIGVEFASKEVILDNEKIKLHLWDTAGQESFRSICRSYYRGADSAIIVYDVSSKPSFDHIVMWLNDIKSTSDDVDIYIVGNKSDLENRVPQYNIDQLFEEYPYIKHFYTSAKEGKNIDNLFNTIASQSSRYLPKSFRNQDVLPTIEINTNKKRREKCRDSPSCC